MFSEKLFSILQTLSKVERNRFRKYLLSPYLNDQSDLVLLFDATDKALRDGTFAELDGEQVWQKLYPNKPYNDAQLRRLSSDLNQMSLRFLSAEARNQNPLAEALDLQRLLEKPELKKHVASVERNIERLLDEVPGQSTEYYLAQFNLHNNIVNKASKHLSVTGYAEKLSAADFYLECFYITQKLELYIGWLLYQGSRVSEKSVELPAGFWEHLENERFNKVPLLTVYRQVVNCLNEPEEESHFKNLLHGLESQSDSLTKTDLRKCYFIAQNYCALKINQGKREYYREVFEIFKKIIKKDILLEEGNLSEGIFKNIVTAGLGVGEFEWTEKFIEEYSPYLPVGIRENARTFNLSYLYFHQKRYSDVLNLLQNVEYNDVVYVLGSKIILIQTYYELQETLALDSLIDSFRIYLRRNKVISKNLKREYINYLGFVKKLTISSGFEKKELIKFREKVMATTSPTHKKWLLEKIDDIDHHKKIRGAAKMNAPLIIIR
ncbi:MAG: hypothetical protein Q7T20_14000 [Saprospiraceae bacterium]|nr:hypothetical protein [Saprospiraceae bacterium]